MQMKTGPLIFHLSFRVLHVTSADEIAQQANLTHDERETHLQWES